jgi:hypothetical protein
MNKTCDLSISYNKRFGSAIYLYKHIIASGRNQTTALHNASTYYGFPINVLAKAISNKKDKDS